MKFVETNLPDVIRIEPVIQSDDRGFFMEVWEAIRFRDAGIDANFVQDNFSHSARGTLRGIHYQIEQAQGKLIRVVRGEIYDVAVDLRKSSPEFGKWVGVFLSADNKHQLWIPPGFAHGFCVTSDTALFAYKCTEFYNSTAEGCVRWDDPEIGINWPLRDPLLSEKDSLAPLLSDIVRERLPIYAF